MRIGAGWNKMRRICQRVISRMASESSIRRILMVEIMNEASGKGDALRRACRYLGGTAEEAAFIGDFFNDIGALKAAGLSACVKNAPQEVKDCCDMVLSDCMDGAVAEFIERVQKII